MGNIAGTQLQLLTAVVSNAIRIRNIATAFHKKEITILNSEINHQRERFNQYESIVEQRINLLTSEAETLKNKLLPDDEPMILYQSAVKPNPHGVSESGKEEDIESGSKVSEFIAKTDIINIILKNATGLL